MSSSEDPAQSKINLKKKTQKTSCLKKKNKRLIYRYSPTHFQAPSQFSLDPHNTVRNGEMLRKETGSISSQQRSIPRTQVSIIRIYLF